MNADEGRERRRHSESSCVTPPPVHIRLVRTGAPMKTHPSLPNGVREARQTCLSPTSALRGVLSRARLGENGRFRHIAG
jgi:hypothetical protein